MPILLTEREQCELRAGTYALGGDGPDAVLVTQLSSYPLVGRITVGHDMPPRVQRLSPRVPLMVDGAMLGATPCILAPGAVVQVGSVRMTYHEHADGAAAAGVETPRRRKESEFATQVMSSIGFAVRPAALIALDTGKIIRLPARDVVIGRAEDADVVIAGKGVSRRHAVLCVDGEAHAITDESTNGTFVNGQRVQGRAPVRAGDTIAFGDAQYRLEHVDPALAARLAGGVPAHGASGHQALAQLEMVRGRDGGKLYGIDRPVCVLGRGLHNDVIIDDDSVAASHATLLLKGDTWFLTDLRSVNGTYVDGYRVAGERALAPGSVIRMGGVALAFWPAGQGKADRGAPARGGVLRKVARALFFGR